VQAQDVAEKAFPFTEDLLANSQRTFYALDMAHPGQYPTPDPDANLHRPGLDVAERDGTLAPVGSVYSSENDAVYDGINRPGPRLVTRRPSTTTRRSS